MVFFFKLAHLLILYDRVSDLADDSSWQRLRFTICRPVFFSDECDLRFALDEDTVIVVIEPTT